MNIDVNDPVVIAVIAASVLIVGFIACLPAILRVIRIRRFERRLGGAAFTALFGALAERDIQQEQRRDG